MIEVSAALIFGFLTMWSQRERPRGVVDGLIAATAAVHSKIIVTRNVTDFADTRGPLSIRGTNDFHGGSAERTK